MPPPEIHLAGEADSSAIVPTHVWGQGSEELAGKWNAKWSTGKFADFRKTFHQGRPLVILISGSGPYANEDYFLGTRPDQDIYVIGYAKPTLQGDALVPAKFAKFYLKNLNLTNCGITVQSNRDYASVDTYLTQCRLADTVGDQNAFGSSNAEANYPWNYWIWDCDSVQCGSRGNTRHAFYVHGRPNGSLWVDNLRVYGSKGCSVIKSTCVTNRIANCYLSAVQDESDLSKGLKSAMLIDVPADSDTQVHHNTLVLYRGAVDAVAGEAGLDDGAICWRPRREIHASDRPPYKSPEWFDETFWTQRAKPFTKIVAYNHFRLLMGPGSRVTPPLRDDGTHPRVVSGSSFGPSRIQGLYNIEPVWWERSETLDVGNTYEGFPNNPPPWDMVDHEAINAVEQTARWGLAPPYQRLVFSRQLTSDALPPGVILS